MIKINRNNYEAFFLMYVDNELPAADRKAVDVFVADNPDLQEELLMLQQTVLKPSHDIFEDKNTLLRTDPVFQEKLLLLLDGELNGGERTAIEKLIVANTAVGAEWNILQQTKITADTSIIFADKHFLYRKEPAKIIGIRRWQVAAAAMLIGIGTWGTVSFLNSNKAGTVETATKDKPPVNTIAGNIKRVDKITAVDRAGKSNTLVDTQQRVEEKHSLAKNDLTRVKENGAVTVKKFIKVPEQENEIVVKQNIPENRPNNNLPRPLQNINNSQRNETLIASVPLRKNEVINVIPENNKTSFGSDKIDGVPKNNNTSYAVNKTTIESVDPEEETDDKKSKLRGLFRKVKRVFERTTNAKSNSNVMIAGFGIAIK